MTIQKNLPRLILKVGSALLQDDISGELRRDWIHALAEDIAVEHKAGTHMLLVSSGAVMLGCPLLRLKQNNLKLEEKQAAAATGQPLLMQAWREALAPHNIEVAQLLLTIDDTDNRRRYLNARNTLEELLQRGIIPIVNENDSVATAELRYGDNDRLAARVAAMAGADRLILLSDVDGLYTTNPQIDNNAQHIAMVDEITTDIENMAGDSATKVGSGGMHTKLQAAKIATSAGCEMIIASGKADHPLRAINAGKRYTCFAAHGTPLSARKHWIASQVDMAGMITVDDGAAIALTKGTSLLAAGVTAIKGHFHRGDTVEIHNPGGTMIGKGLIAYNAEDMHKIIGKHSNEIEKILGYRGRDAVIHRDDMAIE